MINLQSSIDELQKEYNSNYEKIEELEKEYGHIQKTVKRKERREAELRNDIAVHQLMVRNQIIQQCIKSLKKGQIQVNQELQDSTKQELKSQVDCMKDNLVEQYQKLDILSAQETLNLYARTRILSKLEIGLSSVGIGLLSILVIGVGISSVVSQLPLLYGMGISFIASGGIASVLFTGQNKTSKKFFQKLYHEYQQKNLENSLEEQSLNQMTETITNSLLEFHIKKNMLEKKEKETQKIESSKNEMVREQTIEPVQVIESELVESSLLHKAK